LIDKIGKINKMIGFESRQLYKTLDSGEKKIYSIADEFLENYCNFQGFSAIQASKAIEKFILKYKKDMDNFIKTNKFPFELENDIFNLTREEYDLFLISSVLFTKHRFSIIKNISELGLTEKKIALIGVGSGLELAFLDNKKNEINAFDLSLSQYAKDSFDHVDLHEEPFDSSQKYDTIFGIELIEHISEPYRLIENIYSSLKENGIFIVTTIKNVPQFDHLYNFTNEKEFELNVKSIGFSLIEKKVIPHEYRFINLDVNNVMYILGKNND